MVSAGDTGVVMEGKHAAAKGRASRAVRRTDQQRGGRKRAAQAWPAVQEAWEMHCRFDVVGVLCNGPNFSVEHYRDALDFSLSVGGGNTSWQPW